MWGCNNSRAHHKKKYNIEECYITVEILYLITETTDFILNMAKNLQIGAKIKEILYFAKMLVSIYIQTIWLFSVLKKLLSF